MPAIYKSKKSVFNYDEIPPGYYYEAMMHGISSQRFWHLNKFMEIAKKIHPHEKVLDVGCGPGSFLSVLGNFHPTVNAVGIDIAEKQIAYAQQNIATQFSDKRIQFLKAQEPGLSLPFNDNSYDVVTCIEVIEHIHPYLAHKTLQEIRRVLKPEGRLVMSTPNYRSFWPFIEIILDKISSVKYHDQHINKFTPNSFIKFLETCGFYPTRLETIFIASPFLSFLGMNIADHLFKLEKNLMPQWGSLLLAECEINHELDSEQSPTLEYKEAG